MVVSGRRGLPARRLSIARAVSRLVPRFGSSGIRGLGNVDVTPELALHVGMILGEIYGSTIVGRDPRVTGPMLVQALTAGVLSSGAPATDAGLVSTPTLARGAREFACGARSEERRVGTACRERWATHHTK